MQKYTHDGSKLLLQIGKQGVVDSSDGSAKGKALNSSHASFFKPAGIAIDPKNGDVYVADSETPGGNHRIAVFDRAGQFLRQWELHRTEAETGAAFVPVLHCVLRWTTMDWSTFATGGATASRCSIKWATFKRTFRWSFEPMSKLPCGPRAPVRRVRDRLACGVDFSRDPGQKYMCTSSIRTTRRSISSDRASGQILSSFGRPGHQAGEFTYAHFLAVDSKGNLYVGEVGTGKRIQEFKMVGRP